MVCVFLRCQFQSVGLREHVPCSVICPFFHGKIGISPAIHWEEWMFPGCFLIFLGKTQWKPFCWMFLQIFPAIHWFFARLDPAMPARPPAMPTEGWSHCRSHGPLSLDGGGGLWVVGRLRAPGPLGIEYHVSKTIIGDYLLGIPSGYLT